MGESYMETLYILLRFFFKPKTAKKKKKVY